MHKNSHISGWDERSFTDIKNIEKTVLERKLQFTTLKLTWLCVIQEDIAITQLNMWAQSTGEGLKTLGLYEVTWGVQSK